MNYSTLSSQQKVFTLAIFADTEPKSYKEAALSPLWIVAMNDELNAL